MRIVISFLFLIVLLASCQEVPTVNEQTPPKVVPEMSEPKTKTIEAPVEPKLPAPSKETNKQEGFTADYLMGKFSPAKHPDFTKIKSQHSSKSMYMRKDAYTSFEKMYEAAKKDGINLKIISATRPFEAQRGIWEAKWSGARKVDGQDLSKTIPDAKERALKILEFSSMPGTSRHHWGTDIDLNNLNNSWFEKGEGQRIYDWLTANAASYGYCQPYSPKGNARPFGYEEEKWHWSYLPISKILLEEYQKQLTDASIKGFKGTESATAIGVVEKYVEGINLTCQH